MFFVCLLFLNIYFFASTFFFFLIELHSSPHKWLVVDWDCSCLLMSHLVPQKMGYASNSLCAFAAAFVFKTLAIVIKISEDYIEISEKLGFKSLSSGQNSTMY